MGYTWESLVIKVIAFIIIGAISGCIVGCAIDQVGVGATYQNPDGSQYGGNVNVHLRDSKRQTSDAKDSNQR